MSPKVKKIIIFGSIAIVLVVLYMIFFQKAPEDEASLTSLTGETVIPGANGDSEIAGDFLSVLLSVKNISLNSAIFSDPAFLSLRDSSIELIPDGNEGRPNPFAPIGSDSISAPSAPSVTTPSTSTSTPLSPFDFN